MAPAKMTKRTQLIVDSLTDQFEPLMKADPDGFRTKFRKMAADPFAFYRGSACVFYADLTGRREHFSDERTSRVWIHGDLHAENFGTYMNSEGMLVFDVNDFDEAYLGHFTWDLRRFVASLALMGWQKALPEDDIRRLNEVYLRAYVDQVQHYVDAARRLRLRAAARHHRRGHPRGPAQRSHVDPGVAAGVDDRGRRPRAPLRAQLVEP